ncbi:MAG: FAD-binding protein [Devosiaceae bacterium]|nr:FAD-binding protein [Devosiaceae bacterium MH13]
MTTLLIAEHAGGTLSPESAKALTAAAALGAPVDVLVAGDAPDVVAQQAAGLEGVAKVVTATDGAFANLLAEPLAAQIIALADGYDALVMAATTTGKNVMPRVAALLDVMQVSDIISVEGPDTFKRPIYAGNAIQTVRATDTKKVITVRGASFTAAGDGAGPVPIEAVAVADLPALSAFVSADIVESERPELTSAKVILSGGRALGSKEEFERLVLPLAETLGAAVGASRAAVDAGYAPNDWQVGQTGKVVAPDLYIAAGISGAIQHLAGMKDSRIIVAINKDEDAPIFDVADYGLVGDLFEVLPKMRDALEG